MGELSEALQFTFGLINSSNKYLTAESFGFKIAASGPSLKKKQTWSLEQQQDGTDVYFKSFLGRYLAADKNGKVTCDSETPGEENAFQVEATSDGRWAIKSSKYKRYFGGSADNLSCFEQAISPAYLWVVHLAMHPQINVYNVRRKAYAHVKGDELHMTKITPWGVDTLITLVFQDKGYALVTADNRYLATDGSLEKSCSKNCLYTIEFYSGNIAFKSKADGRFLAPVGPKGTVQGRKESAGKDEHFTLVDSHPQVTLFSKTKKKFVSGKQGTQLSANQMDIEETETFQLELDQKSDSVFFRNNKDKYWRLSGNGISADVNDNSSSEATFQIEWHGRFIRLQASNGKYVSVLPSGHLTVSDTPEDFIFRLTNRPLIVFRGEHGFIGSKGDKLDGNKANYDLFVMEEDEGAYAFKTPSGKYWTVDDDKKLAANGSSPHWFVIQLVKGSKIAVKPESGGGFITSDHVGIMTASGEALDKKTLWEY